MTTSLKTGFLSGTVATIVVGSMLLMNNALHSFPEVHLALALAAVLGSPDNVMVGAAAIMVVGVLVFGGLFAVLAPRLPLRTYFAKSLVFAAATWLLVEVVFMPLAGAGFFGMSQGLILPVAALVLSLAYWLTLGFSYRWVVGPAADRPGEARA